MPKRKRPNSPKLPKGPLLESSLPFRIGSKVRIKTYNTFLHNHESSGYKFRFVLDDNNKTGNVDIIDMASPMHEDIVHLLQKFFEVPNGGIIFDPPIVVSGQPLHPDPSGTRVEVAPDVAVRPDIAIIPRPDTLNILNNAMPRPPSDIYGNPHARIMCEIAVGQSIGELDRKCLAWMQQQYVRAVVGIKILEPRVNVREPGTNYCFRTMTARLYQQGTTVVQEWDFGNTLNNSRHPLDEYTSNDPALALCKTPNDPRFRIDIPVSDVFWDPQQFPIPPGYAPQVPANINANVFSIDLYRIQRIALKSKM